RDEWQSLAHELVCRVQGLRSAPFCDFHEACRLSVTFPAQRTLGPPNRRDWYSRRSWRRALRNLGHTARSSKGSRPHPRIAARRLQERPSYRCILNTAPCFEPVARASFEIQTDSY